MQHAPRRKALYLFVSALMLAAFAVGAAPVQPAFAISQLPPLPTLPPGCHFVFLIDSINSVTPAFFAPPVFCPPPHEASITLTVVNPPAGAWTAVQWGIPGGTTWSDVTNWVGPLDQSQYGWMPHWVDPKDYGTGPFRWVVYDKDPSQGGKILGISDPFYFPAGDGQMAWSQITLSVPATQ
jgi:hypothetical protein